MLDPRITQHVENVMRVRAGDFAHSIEDALAAAAAGLNVEQQRPRIFREHLESRARCVFDEIVRSLQLYPQPQLDDELANWLIGLHTAETRKQCTDLQRVVSSLPPPGIVMMVLGNNSEPVRAERPDIAAQLNDRCEQLQQQYAFEIRALVQSRRQQEQNPAAAAITIHAQHIGAVQTGPNATAHVTMNVGSDEREALLAALDLIAGALRDAQQLATTDRAQLLDVVAQARTAAQQPAPNPSLLRGMFLVLCEAVQTLAAAGPAVTALKAAALPFGINL